MIICLLNIQLAKNPRLARSNLTIQTFISYKNKVKDLPTSDKYIMGLRDNLLHNPTQPISKDFGNNLITLLTRLMGENP
jgi:hypothetical protein